MPFDVVRLRPSGSATPLPEEVHLPAVGQPLFSLAASGALAFISDESGQSEIYVRPYPAVDGGRWQISSEGGTRPLWNRDGRELFFLDADMRLAGAPMAANGGGLTPGVARRLLTSPYHPGFSSRGLALRGDDVSLDGQRFLMIRGAETGESHTVVTIALNWSPDR